ncbi:MAG: hypothetical protein ACREQ5_26440 [Candidatus Dormibacteria bacterium]
MPKFDDIVGEREIADMLGVKPVTVRIWRMRTREGQLDFPEPSAVVSGQELWARAVIIKWAYRTGRLPLE